MWISAAAVIITFLVILEPVDEVEAGQSRLVIHTPQRIKTVHKYHTSEIYAKEFGHGEWYYRKKKPKGFRWGHPSHRSSSHRFRFRKGHHRKVGTRTPFIGGKSYGMNNYANNYRNWAPTRRPVSPYRNSYLPDYNSRESQEDAENYSYQSDSYEQQQEDDEYSSNESKPSFENAVKQIDYYATQNRDFQRGSIYDSVSRGGNQDTSYRQDNHPERYSTLPDEFINSPNSNRGKGFHSNTGNFNRGQNLRSKNQGRRQTQFNNNNNNKFGNNRASVYNTHTGDRQRNGYNNHHFDSGQESRFNGDYSSGRKGNRFEDQNFERGHESQFNNQDYFQSQGGNHNSRGEPGERYRDQHSGHDNFNTDVGTSFNSQSFGTVSDFGFTTHVVHSQQNPTNNYRNTQDSHYSNGDHYNTQPQETRNDFSFDKGTVHHDTEPSSHSVRTQRESEGGIEREISITSSRPQSEDAYFKAFRAFSFRKGSASTPDSGGQTQSNSASVGRGPLRIPSITQKSSNVYSVRNSDHWQDPGDGHHNNNDHDIGFFEGLEDVNDGI